ncbi:MAG: toprim domain-containing protein [Microvirga sp.]
MLRAEVMAEALGGRKVGTRWLARCPAHDDRQPSLAIAEAKNGKLLVRCHAGCGQREVIAALRARGIWDVGDQRPISFLGKPDRQSPPEPYADAVRRTEAALAVWRASRCAKGTLAETYLRSRGLTNPVPLAIRFHAALTHPSETVWPAMVALVTRGVDDKPIGIHRTFLDRDGSGKAPVEPAKMMLGPCGAGSVRLGAPSSFLMVGEGIETCLAVIQATGHPAWAALSTSGLRSLELPDDINDVIVLADGDEPGEAAARSCALRWCHKDRRVRIARPPRGLDFNDLLLRDLLESEERRP